MTLPNASGRGSLTGSSISSKRDPPSSVAWNLVIFIDTPIPRNTDPWVA
jgi:hypothetical protein